MRTAKPSGMIMHVFFPQITQGEVKLEALEDSDLSEEVLMKQLVALPGIGPFSAANMLQLLGRYRKIACDSETVRHFRDHCKESSCTSANVEAIAEEVDPLHTLLLPCIGLNSSYVIVSSLI